MRWWCVAVAVALVTGACTYGPYPTVHPQAVLYRDLERVVGFAETKGWTIDRLEVEDALGDALLSVCAVPEDDAVALVTWIDERIAELGDSPAEAWRKAGKDLEPIEPLLTLVRVRALLLGANAARGDCPFWIEPSASFRGRQIADDRWQLKLAGGGQGIISLVSGEKAEATGGGGGRLSLWRHVGARWGFGLGLALAGSADFLRDDMGNRGALIIAFDTYVPLIVRRRWVASWAELEVGPLGHFTEAAPDLVPGLHVGMAFGGSGIRERWLLPSLAVAMSYEFISDSDSGPAQHLIKLGVRVEIDLDL